MPKQKKKDPNENSQQQDITNTTQSGDKQLKRTWALYDIGSPNDIARIQTSYTPAAPKENRSKNSNNGGNTTSILKEISKELTTGVVDGLSGPGSLGNMQDFTHKLFIEGPAIQDEINKRNEEENSGGSLIETISDLAKNVTEDVPNALTEEFGGEGVANVVDATLNGIMGAFK